MVVALSFAPFVPRAVTAQIPRGVATATIAGRVTDTLGSPLPFCFAASPSAGAAVLCDDSGYFRLPGLPSGRVELSVRRLGYRPGEFTLQLLPESTLNVIVQLVPLPTELGPINVTAEGLYRSLAEAGFYERLRMREIGSAGIFITPEEFEALRPSRVTDVLQARPSVQLVYNGQLAVPWGRYGRCLLNVYVDGLEIRNLYEMPAGRSSDHIWMGEPVVVGGRVTGIGIDGFIKPEAVLAMEIYPSATSTPIRFRSANSCGAIVIWTKRP